ncbi:MAG: aldehyde dehydrogenase family protein [Cryomorphaceae bacterium]|jgi:acyl-CoA reductase-like NAD-dependent aldehyde dehydrogenase|nr:aldehyde dehydrogenase family protein [Cryomorphaceae bacterium]
MTRLEILKTYKLYIGGQFPRTESGRYYPLTDKNGKVLANICLSSRKDVRNAVQAARKAFGSWAERSAFNRSQILYRIAEMLEGRRDQFISELMLQGSSKAEASKELDLAIERVVYYAGWCDKFQQVLSSVNPVSTSHFNFSVLEPTGVIGVLSPQDSSLIGLVSVVLPAIAGGNACVVLASENLPLCSITFAELLNSSDLPGGVVNILTGTVNELLETFATHMDINAVSYSGKDPEVITKLKEQSVLNVKRVFSYDKTWMDAAAQDLYMIADLQEVKTTWHPIENIGGATSSY